jgi:hypothetical protein
MKIYLNGSDAVSDLHKKGFTNDFLLSGNDLFWVQGKTFVRVGEFAILECYEIPDACNIKKGFTVFGIVAPYHRVKGILLNRCHINHTTPVIMKKLKEMRAHGSFGPTALNYQVSEKT